MAKNVYNLMKPMDIKEEEFIMLGTKEPAS